MKLPFFSLLNLVNVSLLQQTAYSCSFFLLLLSLLLLRRCLFEFNVNHVHVWSGCRYHHVKWSSQLAWIDSINWAYIENDHLFGVGDKIVRPVIVSASFYLCDNFLCRHFALTIPNLRVEAYIYCLCIHFMLERSHFYVVTGHKHAF